MKGHPELNLPMFEPKITTNQGETYISDRIRKKLILLTPEEWVRQHFINLLIEHLNYPQGLFKIETQHSYNQRSKRSDILIIDRTGSPFLLVECKSYTETLSDKTLSQIATYNKTLNARYIAITNGIKHFVWEKQDSDYRQLKEFPKFMMD